MPARAERGSVECEPVPLNAPDKWFARRFPVGNPRNAMSPVNRAGYAVVVGFVGAM